MLVTKIKEVRSIPERGDMWWIGHGTRKHQDLEELTEFPHSQLTVPHKSCCQFGTYAL